MSPEQLMQNRKDRELQNYLSAPGGSSADWGPQHDGLTGYLWDYTGPVSDDWHNSGGLLIIAPNLETAREAWAQYAKDKKLGDATATDRAPDVEMRGIQTLWIPEGQDQVGDAFVFVFPDAGCC